MIEDDIEYTPDQQRAAKFIVELTGVGGGVDPIGFLLTCVENLVAERKRFQWNSDIEKAPKDGTELIFWVSSEKGFPDICSNFYWIDVEKTLSPKIAELYPEGSGWYWADSEDILKRPDLVKGWMLYPKPQSSLQSAIEYSLQKENENDEHI